MKLLTFSNRTRKTIKILETTPKYKQMRGNLNRNKFVKKNKSIKMDMGQSNVQTVLFFPFWETKASAGPASIWTVGDALQDGSKPSDSDLLIDYTVVLYFNKKIDRNRSKLIFFSRRDLTE